MVGKDRRPQAVSGDITRWVLGSDFGAMCQFPLVPAYSQDAVPINSASYVN